MPTRPTQPDPSGTQTPGANAFAGLGAGLDFFQDWMKAASSALPNLGGSTPAGNSAWTMPTLDPEELDKRIKELKTVQFWLEQNARMIGMTIQTLEVQRMTLNTLREMKVPVDALKDALKAQGPAAAQAQAEASTEGAAPGVNPMAWWGTLTEQFSTLASQAVAAGQEAMSAVTPVAPVAPEAKSAKASAPPKAAGSAASKGAKSGAAHHADDAPAASQPRARKAPRR